MPATGSLVTLDVEKPATGGRMLARLDRRVVLVSGAIPGERVTARIERVGKGVIFAETVEVLSVSADRRSGQVDARCGGNLFGHIDYPRQLQLKAEIIRDTFARIGRVPLASVPDVIGSPEQGYRMRARFHVSGWRIGFFREGSHELCDAAATGQLLPETCHWIAETARRLRESSLQGVHAIDLAENIAADQRVCHFELEDGVDAIPFAELATGPPVTGVSAAWSDRPGAVSLAGQTSVVDVIHVREGDAASALRLRRDVRAFFQANRFLLERLVRHVTALVPEGPVVDLYAGVGLFGLALAAAGRSGITLVEGDPVSAEDLSGNAEPFGDRVRVERGSVESFLRSTHPAGTTCVVDPPRTGLSREAIDGVVRAVPPAVVYVSCDVATLARDVRLLLDAGYELGQVTAFDLFPNTAHIETIATLVRPRG